ncbi:hypothetical protein M378DRAFT_80836 [Amanita muscaria Koide BX008]|uniref:Large ribosomal subunit protein mL59 domain-containing protein n=1 Tax=Amanita muscaria (strain Koide BX008) TaxID=946122 RepID=A0A0C2X0R5_AMAMK|nr:hypothetical protein M378DRAFT_80836 [Amanita muscaria Koide BX008]
MSAALQAIKKFRLHEIKGLQKHILRFGPLQTQTSVDTSAALRLPNPFVPRKNPNTGRWAEPKYSLRRQTELVKKAGAAGLLHLLPPGPKNPLPASPPAAEGEETQSSALKEMWALPVAWEGSREYKPVPGTELGIRLYAAKKRMFKGHKWERVKGKREARKHILLRDMDKRIFNYKNYYKRRRPNPLKPPRTVKAPKLPF